MYKYTGPPSAPGQPYTGLDRIRRKNSTHFTAVVVWNSPDDNNAHISSYVVTVDPAFIILPSNGIIPVTDPHFQVREISLDLQHGQRYSISVRADSCNNTQHGAISTPFTINAQGIYVTLVC